MRFLWNFIKKYHEESSQHRNQPNLGAMFSVTCMVLDIPVHERKTGAMHSALDNRAIRLSILKQYTNNGSDKPRRCQIAGVNQIPQNTLPA